MPSPAFFDIFGVIAFLFVVAIAAIALFSKKSMPKLYLLLLLLVGLGGFLVDALIVYTHFLG